MRSISCLVFAMLVPAAVRAQPPAFAVWERPAAGMFIGPSSESEQDNGDAGRHLGFVVDTPVVFGYRARADVSRVVWHFQNRGYPPGPAISHAVSVKSIRLGMVAVWHDGPRLSRYAGGGYGVYRFDDALTPLRRPWRGGMHGVAGIEVLSGHQRFAFDGELRLHAINGARQAPLEASLLLELDAAVGMKLRF